MAIGRLPSAEPDIARDIATIIENEKDMRVILKNAQPESRREWYMKGYRDAQDAALHESCTDCPLYDHDKHRCPRFNKVIPTTIQEILDTQTQRWIPVTERLPGEDDYKPCYGYEDGAVWWLNDMGLMGLGWYYPSTGKWAYYDESDGCDKCVGNVVAWMSLPDLPEPYRVEEKHDR